MKSICLLLCLFFLGCNYPSIEDGPKLAGEKPKVCQVEIDNASADEHAAIVLAMNAWNDHPVGQPSLTLDQDDYCHIQISFQKPEMDKAAGEALNYITPSHYESFIAIEPSRSWEAGGLTGLSIHELGHSMGLGHDNRALGMMNSNFYAPYQLTEQDIDDMRQAWSIH